jgi:hypothetical protein
MEHLNIYNLKQLSDLCHAAKCARYPAIQPHLIPKTKYIDKTANGLTKAVKRYIELIGGQVERVSNMGRYVAGKKLETNIMGVAKTTEGKYIRGTGTNGTADIHATIKGRSVKIEIKIGKDRQSEAQRIYQQQVERAGGIYLIIRNFEDLIKNISLIIK